MKVIHLPAEFRRKKPEKNAYTLPQKNFPTEIIAKDL